MIYIDKISRKLYNAINYLFVNVNYKKKMKEANNMKNKIILITVSLILALSLCACFPIVSIEKDSPDESKAPIKTEFNIGETWKVEGQWSLTVDSVSETEDRNEFEERRPAAVYIVDYTYTNIGYEDEYGLMDGLFFGMEDSIVDSTDLMGYSYPGNITRYPTPTPIGATCKAQSCIGVDNAGTFKINVNTYDGKGNEETATFVISVPED